MYTYLTYICYIPLLTDADEINLSWSLGQLFFFQDLIGLEGDDLVDFMPSAGNKYGTYLWLSLAYFLFCKVCDILFTDVGQQVVSLKRKTKQRSILYFQTF